MCMGLAMRRTTTVEAMATNSYLFLFLFLFSSLCNLSMVIGANTKVSPPPPPDMACSSKEYKNRGLKIVHRYGPCSPLDGEKATPIQILQQDQSRVSWLQSRLTRDSSRVNVQDTTIPARPGNAFATGNYIVTVGFGIPKMDMTLEFDTGSDLTWIQCQPCAGGCYQQQEPIFNPADSSTYVSLSCNSVECSQLNLPTRCSSSSTCVYLTRYGDGSQSSGFLSRDTLTLSSSDIFLDFQFGCGQQNEGLFGRAAGLLGLGRDSVSLVSQTANQYGRVFSYCLPSSPNLAGHLTFGANAIPSDAKFTPLLADQNSPSFYFLNLVAMSVSGKPLPIPESTFSSRGSVIDSGTVITRLPSSAYSRLRSAFQKEMSNYTSATSPSSVLETCYELNGGEALSVPSIVMHFEGDVDVNVDYSGIIYKESETVGCLAFMGNDDEDDFTIIGNRQQLTLDVVYDVAGGRLGFGAGGCR